MKRNWRTAPMDKLTENERDARIIHDAGFPGMDPSLYSKSKKPDFYGIDLTKEADAALNSPSVIAHKPKKKPGHDWRCRPKGARDKALQQRYRQSGYKRKVDFMEFEVIDTYLRVSEQKNAPGAATPRTNLQK